MFIEKIIIANFRSFENGRIENLSVGQNVFVGPNGSGKSNIVLALEFVLTKNHHHLTGKQKNLFICQHQLSKRTVIEAAVEIHLNNKDGHFPLPEKSIVIKRQISTNYDHHFINGRRVKMVEVMSLLESGGFSPDNSYYLVKQGLIGEIAVSDARYRLEILRSISGAKSFDEKRAKSLELIKESEQLLVQIEKLIKAIQFDLSLLSVDEAKVKRYEKLCKIKKYVLVRIKQYRLVNRQSYFRKCEQELDKLFKQLEADQKELADLQNKLNKVQSRLESTVEQIKNLQTQFESCKTLMESLPGPTTDLQQQPMDRDVQEDWCQISSLRISLLQDQLQKTLDDHSSDQLELFQMIEKEQDLKHQMESLLNKKLNYHNLVNLLQSEHTTQQQRNQLIMDKFIKVSDQHVEETRRTLLECENNLKILKTEKNEIEKLIKLSEQKSQPQIDEMESLNKEITNLACQNKLQEMNLCKVMNELSLLQKESLNLENELKKLENWLDLHTCGMAISSKKSINLLLDSLKSSLENDNLDPEEEEGIERLIRGYYGQIVDCFELCKPVDYSMEVLMKNNIFYHVVQDEHIAVQLLDRISQKKLTGSFRMVAVNRVASILETEDQSIDCDDCQELYHCIKNRQPRVAEVEVALKSLFKGLYIARSFAACWWLFQNYRNCDFATLDGESIDRFGVVSRISMVKPTRLQMYKRWLDHKQRLDEMKQKMQVAEMKRDQLLEEKSLLTGKLAMKREKLLSLQEDLLKIQEQGDQSQNLNALLNKIEQQIRLVRSELHDSQSRMSCLVEEQNFWQLKLTQESLELDLEPMVAELTAQIDCLREKLQSEVKHRKMWEMRVGFGQTNINELKAKLNQVKYKISNQTWSVEQARNVRDLEKELSAQRDAAQQQICLLNAQIMELNQVKSELESEMEKLKEKYEKCFNKCDAVRKRLQVKQDQYRKMKAEFEKVHLELELVSPLTDIGNDLDFGNLDQMDLDQLNLVLKDLNRKMKLLDQDGGNVNRETLRSFRELGKKMDHLNRAKKQQNDTLAQIRNMIKMIEQRKDEFVLRTYKQVNYHFQRIFQQFVPQGYGCLRFLTAASAPSDSSTTSSSFEQSVDSYQSDEFKGIEILVSFTNPTGPDSDLMSLSGGQKALVSLTLIFALQQVDPMPFYIFDEVDQSLDQTHRIMVAKMIKTIATEQKKQFLITTFHTEIVEQTDQAYAVRNINGLSRVEPITKEAALEFLSSSH